MSIISSIARIIIPTAINHCAAERFLVMRNIIDDKIKSVETVKKRVFINMLPEEKRNNPYGIVIKQKLEILNI